MGAAKFGMMIVAALVAAAPAVAQPVVVDAMPVDPRMQMRSVELAKLIVNIRRGDRIGVEKWGLLCIPHGEINWGTGVADAKDEVFQQAFREKFKELNLPIADDPSNMFQDDDVRADFLVGGAITRIDLQACYKQQPITKVIDLYRTRGSAAVDVEWQIFSQLDRKVVAKIRVTGNANRPSFGEGGPFAMVFDAFGDAAAQLARHPRFIEAVRGSPMPPSALRATPKRLSPIQVRAAAPGTATLTDVVGSTVLVLVPGGHGSGVLIGPDGYILTNHHVVGASPYVKIRWADGAEVLGEVLRSDKARDVALVKVDVKGRRPLPMRLQPLAIGEDIYAVGAPADPKLQSTVTKGIVSAKRIIEGLNYIQGDAAITPGNSGGPIVDAKGQVVGLTVAMRVDAAMVNYFIPIDDALSFLGMQMITPPPAAPRAPVAAAAKRKR